MIIDRKNPPEIKSIEQVDILQAQKVLLHNGVPVYTINNGTQELIKVEFLFSAGIWYQPLPLVAAAANTMLNEGTRSLTGSQIADSIDYCGAFLEMEVDYDFASVSLYTLNKHLETTLQIVEDIIKNSIFPQTEFDTYLQNKKQKFLVDSKKVNTIARKKFHELIFGGHHPYGYNVNVADFDLLKCNHLVAFHEKYYNPDNCKIIISGKVSEVTLKLIDKYFGHNWNSKKNESIRALSIEPHKENKHLLFKDDAVQSAIRIGKPLFNKTHSDYMSMHVLNTILGGYFGSRLMANIREEKGYTYGIGSGIISLQNAGYFYIATEVGVDVCSKAIDEIYFELKRLSEQLVPDSELELVKNYMLGDFLRSVNGPFTLADKLKSIMEYGLDYGYYSRFIDTIKKISSEDLMKLANKYLQPESMHEVVVGKR